VAASARYKGHVRGRLTGEGRRTAGVRTDSSVIMLALGQVRLATLPMTWKASGSMTYSSDRRLRRRMNSVLSLEPKGKA